MKLARVPFHGCLALPFGVREDETMQECEDCHDPFDLLQIRLSEDGHFRCEKCTEHDRKQAPLPAP